MKYYNSELIFIFFCCLLKLTRFFSLELLFGQHVMNKIFININTYDIIPISIAKKKTIQIQAARRRFTLMSAIFGT